MNFLRRWSEKNKRARRLLHADRLREEGDLTAALAEYEAILREEPENLHLLREVAELRALTGRSEAAVEALCDLLERDFEEMPFLGITAFDAIRSQPIFRPVFETVLSRLQAHLADHPEDVTARFSLAEAFEMAGDSQRAFAVYDVLAENSDSSIRGRALYAKARLAITTGELAHAANALRAAFEANSTLLSVYDADPAFEANREEPLLRNARAFGVERHLESLRTALERDPQNVALYRQLLDLLTAQERFDEVVDLAVQAAERIPEEVLFLEYLANAYFAAERFDEAFEVYQDILRRNPCHLWALYCSGVLYERRGQRTAARESYQDALAELRNEPDVALLLARGFARLHDVDSALRALQQAEELSSSSDRVPPEALLERIESAPDWGTLSEHEEFRALVSRLRESLDT